jgi:NAD(P)-dependent dehydrogenase (short-subunit alcohol dehydrogenase family)
VTGASSGLGRRAALVLARAGASSWRRTPGRGAGLLAGGNRAPSPSIPHDLADRDGLADLAARATPFGAPDILVHAAGINTREPPTMSRPRAGT